MGRLHRKPLPNNIGERAEHMAADFLKRQGLRLEQANYHCRFGEIDMIMRDADTWVFVEVRCRAEGATVNAIESITPQKIRKIRKTAMYFMAQFGEMPDCRFDVIAMSHRYGKINDKIAWFKHAF